ncbi:c-type cytochrome [Polyangium sp. y55x31]|uniref:c-type cytochrome n=1 Tax=Polyangium sp. y55x31 TaxID=3042688 RepID=UPI002482F3D2|nr:c-type cytochrome [Polyangium sp. y55x31]MDI1477883.1 c-type cytochrome [Polyangium sp. y55x31]
MKRVGRGSRRAARLGLLLLALGAGCKREDPPAEATSAAEPDPLPALRAFEAERRAATDFAALPPSDAAFGADPYAIAALPGGERFVALLRGRDAIVVLDASMRELARLPAPASPSGLVVTPDGRSVFVVGERDAGVRWFEIQDTAPYLARKDDDLATSTRGLRDVAAGPEGAVYAVEEDKGRLFTLWPNVPNTVGEVATIGGGPIHVERVGSFVVIDALFAHALVIRPVDEAGRVLEAGEARIVHDGPIWGFSAVPDGDGLLVLAGGVEDRPLDRRGGFFGYIDSFVLLYRVERGAARLLSAVNVAELGVVTPKALDLAKEKDGTLRALVTGYGGEASARLVFDASGKTLAIPAKTSPTVPGIRDLVMLPGGGFVGANPLLDAFVIVRPDEPRETIVPVVDRDGPAPPSAEARLGEALFFTTLMAPENGTEDAHSRFTCETCHFEGYVDGRIHHTGRGEVRVVTKPLVGLFNNRPHFSRALDPDLSSVAHAEFRVAGAGSGHSPWFSLDARTHPALAALGRSEADVIEPLALRRALMTFLMNFSHRQNPTTAGQTSFSALEREGAKLFEARCEGCHEARLSADEKGSRVPFERWESLIFTPAGPIVWGSNEYQKTGVMPYVHERGARVPSLRRLGKKRPYLTSGTAKDLADLLARARWSSEGGFFHDGAPEGASALDAREREALRAFLELL